ncbi:hypothetical protein HRbin29_02148 [bacterium HR29]|nr:hypothetical protein HRbin29_02148 [bacterium HR29]
MAFVARVAAVFFLAAVSAVAARSLPVDQFGVFRTAATAIGAAASIGGSFAASLGYFVANRRHPEGEVASNGMVLAGGLGLLALAAGASAWAWTSWEHRDLALLVGVAVFPIVGRFAVGGVFLGSGRIGWSVLAVQGFGVPALVLLLLWVVALDHRTGADALATWIAAQYVTLGIAAARGWRWWGWFAAHRPDPRLMRAMAAYGAVTGLAGVMTFLNYRVDQLLVAGLDGTRGAGLYAAAVSLAEGLWIVSASVAVATYAPIGSGERQEAAELTARAVRHTLIVVTLLAVPLAAAGGLVLEGIFGSAYGEAVWAFRILCAGTLLFAPQGTLANFYSVQLGRPGIALALAAASTAINVAVSFALIPRFGYVGGAWATAASYAAVSAVSAWLFVRLSGLPFRSLWRPEPADVAAYFRLARRAAARAGLGAGTRPAGQNP